MNYKVTVDGKEIEYGALIEKSRFSEKEWSTIYAEIVKQNQPEVFESKKSDTDYIDAFGALIALEERYEALLELLPQDQFSERCDTFDQLKGELKSYFELD